MHAIELSIRKRGPNSRALCERSLRMLVVVEAGGVDNHLGLI